jgi:hypothetical protein
MDNNGILQAASKPLAGGPELDHQNGLVSSTAIFTTQNLEGLTGGLGESSAVKILRGRDRNCLGVAKWHAWGDPTHFQKRYHLLEWPHDYCRP